jgi:formylglycine-generating enzyme required for sulfatase activity
MKDYGWCGEGFDNSGTKPVRGKRPNAFGLYDTIGNVSEWVSDWFSPGYYGNGAKADPKGPSTGTEKSRRGGAFASDPKSCQSAWRESDLPSLKSSYVGFRVAYTE